MRYFYHIPWALPILCIVILSLFVSSCAPATPSPTTTPVAVATESVPTPTAAASQQPRLPLDQPWVRVGRQILAPGTESASVELETSDAVSIPIAVTTAPHGSYLAYVDISSIPAQLMLRDLADDTTASVPAGENTEISEVRFAPDSSALVYTLIGEQSWQLRIRTLADGAEQVLLQGSLLPSGDSQLPQVPLPITWTPAGLWVRFVLWGTDAPAQGLALLDPLGGSVIAELRREHLMAYPAPDGTRVALMTGVMPIGAVPQTTLVVADLAEGTEQTIIPERQGFLRMLAWSPNGDWLLAAATESYDAPTTTLTAMRTDGSDTRSLVFGTPEIALSLRDLAWNDGTPLLLVTDDQAGQLFLQELPLDAFDPAGLHAVASMALPDAQTTIVQIVYVPE